jgi:hypothetical protein
MSQPNIAGLSEGLAKSIDESLDQQNNKPTKPLVPVAVSVSEPEDAASLGFTEWHLQDALVEVSRYLLVHGCKLLYGGDLRKGGFTEIFSELAKVYSAAHIGTANPAASYFAWPIHLQLSRADETEFKANGFDIHKLPVPQAVNVDAEVYLKPDNLINQVIWSKSLSLMRKEMAKASKAAIVMGGRKTQYMGMMPGVLEEILVNLEAKKPLYIAGAFGGIAKAVGEVLQGNENESLTEDFQLRNPTYKDLFLHWNNTEEEKISYQTYVENLKDLGLKDFSTRNGLTEDENRRLFVTPHITEITQLILKGLTAIALI